MIDLCSTLPTVGVVVVVEFPTMNPLLLLDLLFLEAETFSSSSLANLIASSTDLGSQDIISSLTGSLKPLMNKLVRYAPVNPLTW